MITVSRITHNNRKKTIEIAVGALTLPFPYARLELPPSAADPIVRMYLSRSRGVAEIRDVLKSRRTGSVEVDAIMDYNNPPFALSMRLIRELSLAAQERMKSTPLSVREICRRLSTSSSQLYLLLDEKNSEKSMEQVVGLVVR